MKSGRRNLRRICVWLLLLSMMMSVFPAAVRAEEVDGYSIAAGASHSLLLRPDGTVLASGKRTDDRCNVSSWIDIRKIAANQVSLGLKQNGTVILAGKADSMDVSAWTDIVDIALGAGNAVGLKRDGSVVATGANQYGQCKTAGWQNVIQVAAGDKTVYGLRQDGTVLAAGANSNGQAEVSGWRNIIAICAGASHVVGLKRDGTVLAAGSNDYGQCDVRQWKDVHEISAGAVHTVALMRDGTVEAVGQNQDKQCEVSEWKNVITVSAGQYHTLALQKDGTVLSCGSNGYQQCDLSSRMGTGTGYQLGDTVLFGSDDWGEDILGKKPIEWIILDNSDNRLLLMSRSVYELNYGSSMSLYPFDHFCSGDDPWAESGLRKWLNEDFLQDSFTDAERELIVEHDVCPFEGGKIVSTDAVRVLNIDEAEQLLPAPEDRVCTQARGKAESGTFSWYLVTDRNKDKSIVYVDEEGKLTVNQEVHWDCTVRPVISVEASGFDELWRAREASNMLMSAPGPETVFGSEIPRSEITAITFRNSLHSVPEDAWDVSSAQDGSVMAWTVSGKDTSELVIAAEGKIRLPKDCSGLFSGYSKLRKFDFGSAVTSAQTTDMRRMFAFCSSLESISFSGLNTAAVTDLSELFRGCAALTAVNLNGVDTANVRWMQGMFAECCLLKTLNLSSFHTEKVVSMNAMFESCLSLKKLNLNSFDTSKVRDMSTMFYGCEALKSVTIGTFDLSSLVRCDTFASSMELQINGKPAGEYEWPK